MKKKQRKKIGKYIRCLADCTSLRDWSFTLFHEPLPEESGAFATVKPVYGRKIAEITLCNNFVDLDPDKQRHILVHELIHCHFDMCDNFFENVLQQLVGIQVYKTAFADYRQWMEFGVDAMAEALAPHLPLPPKL